MVVLGWVLGLGSRDGLVIVVSEEGCFLYLAGTLVGGARWDLLCLKRGGGACCCYVRWDLGVVCFAW